jgi:hypothetical protein
VDAHRAVQDFADTAALWNVEAASTRDVVLAACDVLGADADGPAMRMLAAVSTSSSVSRWDVDDLVVGALRELGRSLPPRGTEAAAEAALAAMARRLVRGVLTSRALASWAHRVMGHGGPARAQPLVELHHAYNLAVDGYDPRTVRQLDAEVLRHAARLAAGR